MVERTTEVGGRLNTAAPKSKKAREIAIPRAVADVLANRVKDRVPDDLVFTTPAGTPLRNLNWRRDVHWTFGSLARLASADLKYIQKALGHSSITVTASIYAHLFDTELDQVSDALDALSEGNFEAACGHNPATEPDSDPEERT